MAENDIHVSFAHFTSSKVLELMSRLLAFLLSQWSLTNSSVSGRRLVRLHKWSSWTWQHPKTQSEDRYQLIQL